MSELALLHLSDVQFGDLCMAKCDPDQPQTITHDSLFKSLFAALIENWAKPDVIAITGDITSRASPLEFAQALMFFEELSRIYDDPPVPTVVVPGNHDVSWDISNLDAIDGSGGGPSQRWSNLRFHPYLCLAQEISTMTTDCKSPIKEESPGSIIHTCAVGENLIVGINTAIEEDASAKPHHGRIAIEQVEAVRAAFQKTEGYRILLLHHHLKPQKDPVLNDFSVAQNSQALLEAISEVKIDLVLHGHRHHPFNYTEGGGTGHLAQIFCAASTATIPRERRGGDDRCAVHLIRIMGRSEGNVYGVRKTLECSGASGYFAWKATGAQEIPLRDERFGNLVTRDQAKRSVSNILEKLDPDFRHLGRALEEEPSLFGCGYDLLQEVLAEALGERSLRLTNTSHPLRDWVAYKAN